MSTRLSGASIPNLSCSQQQVRTRSAAFGVAGRRHARVARQQLLCQAHQVRIAVLRCSLLASVQRDSASLACLLCASGQQA